MLETGRRPDRAFESFLGNIDDNYPRRHKTFWVNRQKTDLGCKTCGPYLILA